MKGGSHWMNRSRDTRRSLRRCVCCGRRRVLWMKPRRLYSAITFNDLLTHGDWRVRFHRGPIARAYREALGNDIDSDVNRNDWIARLARLPLIGQPGSAMLRLRSRSAWIPDSGLRDGASLGTVLERRISIPLGMKDTGFIVPREKRARRAVAYGFDDEGKLTKQAIRSGVFVAERPDGMAYESGGAGSCHGRRLPEVCTSVSGRRRSGGCAAAASGDVGEDDDESTDW